MKPAFARPVRCNDSSGVQQTAARRRDRTAQLLGGLNPFLDSHSGGMRLLLRIDDDFTDRTTEQDFQPIQNVAAQDAFAPDKVRLQSARVILPIKPCPDPKRKRRGGTACDATD